MKNIFFIVLTVLCLLTGCSSVSDTNSHSMLNIIVSSDVNLSEERIHYINEVLKEKGYDYQVAFTCMETSGYETSYLEEVKAYVEDGGAADIIYTGSKFGYDDCCEEFIRSGTLLELSQNLNNSKLYEIYDEIQWKSMQVDGGIYTIPNEHLPLVQSIIAINKQCINENELEKYENTKDVLLNLNEIYQNMNQEHTYPLVCDLMGDGMAELLDLWNQGMYFVDRETNEVMLPLENKDFVDTLFILNQIYVNGNLDTSLFTGEAIDIEERFRSGDFSIYIGYDSTFFSDENYYIYKTPIYREQLYGSALGIYSQSENVDEAFQLLTLLRTDEDVANAFILGKEDSDYQMMNGIACDMEGTPIDCFRLERILGTYELVKTCSSDYTFGVDKRIYRNEVLNEMGKTSPYAGFVPKCDISEEIESNSIFGSDMFVELCTITDEKNKDIFWDVLESYKMSYTSDAKDYINEINVQLRSYLKK